VVECTGVGEAFVGRLGGTASEGAERMSETFSEAGLETRARTDMPTVLWRKLAVNAGINPVTSLTRLTNGEAVERAGGTVRRAVEEVVDVAEARGVDVGDAYERTVEVARSTASNRSSMLQDVERGNRTEIDAINGYVVDVARDTEDVDVPVPVNRSLTEMVRASEADSARSEGRGRDGRDTTEGGKDAY
ncbi:MAG: 2-dehydropantoate 2-reductase, partial [Halobacteria archaeon]|nr:2-dehydropantoate 2-reductase [Halobacteria archaeon]